MLIREARSTDCTALIELMQQLGYQISSDEIAANLHLYEKMQGFVFVVAEDEKAVAMISGVFVPLFHRHEMLFRITTLVVHEEKRGNGLGKALLQRIEELCRKKDCDYLEVTSGAHRKKDAHLFYETQGYTMYKGRRFTKRLSQQKKDQGNT
jgi:N-acetylglutamate synthase-like GNAT family acetyltransferase